RTTTRTPVVSLGDEGSVPRQQRVWRHDRGELAQQPSSQGPGFRGEPTALVVGEAPAPGADLFAQDAVLFQEIVDDVALLLVDPAGKRDENELQGMRQRRHGGKPIRAEFIDALERPFQRRSGFWTARPPERGETRGAQSHCWTQCRKLDPTTVERRGKRKTYCLNGIKWRAQQDSNLRPPGS